MENLESLLENLKVVAIVCDQWGDTGKGKFVDYFADVWADVIVRGTGANNAGHTIKIGDEEYIFHLVPSGIINDKAGKINIIGNGVLVNPAVLLNELDVLDNEYQPYDGLRLSNVAHMQTPDDMVIEAFKEKAKGKAMIGTTMRGVGPGFASKIARDNVRIGHLFNKDEFIKRYKSKFDTNLAIVKNVFGATEQDIAELVSSERFKKNGEFGIDRLDFDEIAEKYFQFADRLKPFVINTQKLIAGYRKAGKKVLLEGAQGLLLSIEHGTYPFVTSSDCSAAGLASGAGIPPNAIGLVLGIAKMFYMTRVGGGPFPTEFIHENAVAEGLMNKPKDMTPKEYEKKEYSREATLRSIGGDNNCALSRYCRVEGGEYGATTGRPRRTGWLDLVAMRYAIGINGPDVISTKTDVLDHLEAIKLCDKYQYTGPAMYSPDSGKFFQTGEVIDEFPTDPWILEHCKPLYIEMPGWNADTSGARDYNGLPANAKKIFEEVEKRTGARIRVISVGPERSQTIVKG